MSIKNNKGITLIALVITIIVLLILAGVTISMVLGDNGIIAQAQAAKKAQIEGENKDQAAISGGLAALSDYTEGMSQEEVSKESKVDGTPQITNATPGMIAEIKKFDDGIVPIPKGMAYLEGNKVDEGIVVVDKYGNEFVWVPVSNTDTFTVLTKGWYSGSQQTWVGTEPTVLTSTSYDGNTKNLEAILEEKYLTEEGEYTTDGLTEQFTEEYNTMVESVKTYGGFYVGRYETSWTGSKVASVRTTEPGQVMTAATDLGENWKTIRSDNKATWYGLYAKQKELHANSSSIVSGMIYGCQWDAIMNWMENIPNDDQSITDATKKFYIKNSTGMGNYRKADNTYEAIATGSNDNYKVNNIYDLAGNYHEWTQEANGTLYRVCRGGYYGNNGSYSPASSRYNNRPADAYDYDSSRLQLYIK